MITLKYKKTGDATFVSHIDTLRYLTRAMRRTGYEIEYSKGFNPHMLLNLSSPLAMGVNSDAEYVTIGIEGVSAEEFLATYNKVTTPNLLGLNAWTTEKNSNIAGICVASAYVYTGPEVIKAERAVAELMASENFEITYVQKGATVTKDVRNLIQKLYIKDGVLTAVLSSGNTNLRADRFFSAFCNKAGIPFLLSAVKRTAQLIDVGGKLVNVDSLLQATAK